MLPSTDVATVRAEVKTWERSFRAARGRDPSVQDIRDDPLIAQKYKLYKKLSKLAATAVSSSLPIPPVASHPPSTPPRSSKPRDCPSLLLSKPRAGVTTAPLVGFNPFSPDKKGKQKQTTRDNDKTRPNPFATPAKGRTSRRLPSPDPFPTIHASQASTSGFALLQPAPSSAVNRARKRLRGDPVSPSPNKEKRQRTVALPFSKLDLNPPINGDSDGDEAAEANSSFVDDSPVKAPVGGKPFKLLFEEANPPAKGALVRSKTTSAGRGLFGERIERTWSLSADWDDTRPKKAVHGNPFPSLTQSDHHPKPIQVQGKPGPSKSIPSQRRTSSKHKLSDTEVDTDLVPNNGPCPSLPRSPPLPDVPSRCAPRYKDKGKEKSKLKGSSRKKAKYDEEDETEDGSQSSDQDIVVDLSRQARSGPNDDASMDFETDSSSARARFSHINDTIEEGTISINLPDKLHCMLALSPSKSRSPKNDRVVRGLIFGERKPTHYDAEIWGVGEERGRDSEVTEGEDDWEGEGIPWEVGEL